mmetsp:Transcript_107956/g.328116  ORF Transcript_107956/g.328116 Transcript_107956/m.328116 type:complete len:298 (-) Transcript_107956:52-945(-)
MCGRSPQAPGGEFLRASEHVKYEAQETMCGCCNGGYGKDCGRADCVCPEDSFPVQAVKEAAARSAHGKLFVAEEALDILDDHRILFLGDSSTRRLMWALCSFITGKKFDDRAEGREARESVKCSIAREANADEHDPVQQRGVLLAFTWAPSLEEFAEKRSHKDAKFFDLFVTNLGHWDRLKQPNSKVEELVAGFASVLQASGPPTVVLTPNLVAHQPKVNKDVLAYAQAMQSADFSNSSSRVYVSDSSSWMRKHEGSFERHPCLSFTNLVGIHVNNNYGQAMRVQQVLSTIALALQK